MTVNYESKSDKIATHHYRNAFRSVVRKSEEGNLCPRETVGSEMMVSRYLSQMIQQCPSLCKEFLGTLVSLECLYEPLGNLHRILFLLGHLERKTEELTRQGLPIVGESIEFCNLGDGLDRVVVSLV